MRSARFRARSTSARRPATGQMIDVSMLESMLSLTLERDPERAVPRSAARRARSSARFSAKDGYIMLAVASERTFQNMAVAAGQPGMDRGPALQALRQPPQQLGRADRRVGGVVDGDCRPPRCRRSSTGNGVPSSPYRTVAEAMEDPQLAHREALATVHDQGGELPGAEPAVPHVGKPERDPALRARARRRQRCSAEGAGVLRGGNGQAGRGRRDRPRLRGQALVKAGGRPRRSSAKETAAAGGGLSVGWRCAPPTVTRNFLIRTDRMLEMLLDDAAERDR